VFLKEQPVEDLTAQSVDGARGDLYGYRGPYGANDAYVE
jgi:hypothetical protein